MTRHPPPAVAVHEITNGGYAGPKWLCGPCVEKRKAARWTVKVGMPLPAGSRCGDCVVAEQAAPGYVTPTVDFVAPDPDSRLPSRAAVARMPGVAPMKPWPKRDEKKQIRRAA